MPASYDVRVWKIGTYKGARGNTYRVRWTVGGKPFKETFQTRALADAFRSGLISATKSGESFDTATGRPTSTVRASRSQSWFSFACAYVDMKWPTAAANYRRSIAEALTSVTFAMIDESARRRPPDDAIRRALIRHAFNASARNAATDPAMSSALRWLESATRPVADLTDARVCRAALDATATTVTGRPAAATTARRGRAVFVNAVRYAVEVGALTENPINSVMWRAKRVTHSVDRRAVVNPRQAAELLTALAYVGDKDRERGARLRAFFGLMYYAAARPAEALHVRKADCELPRSGWGWVTLHETRPTAGKAWTDSGETHDRRGLKHRADDDTRRVPLCPPLVELLRAHLDQFGAADDGRLFRSPRGGVVGASTYSRVWEAARAFALPDAAASPLAGRPYDLRHAAVSTWLNGGVAPTQVAAWAGHSVAVLLEVYAKCIDGQQEAALSRIDAALNVDAYLTRTPVNGG